MSTYKNADGFIDPWIQLWVMRIHQRKKNINKFLTASELQKRTAKTRKELLGTDISLKNLVRDEATGQPNEAAVEDLSQYLGERLTYFLREFYPTKQMHNIEKTAVAVMYFGLLFFAYDIVEEDTLDDLITWTMCFTFAPEALALSVKEDLPPALGEVFLFFARVLRTLPENFTEATTAAIAVLTGVLEDPFNKLI